MSKEDKHKEDKHKEEKTKYEKNKDKELHELNQIKYKSMILPNNRNVHNNLSPRESNDSNIANINDFLEKEKQQHVGEQWCKLDKTSKMEYTHPGRKRKISAHCARFCIRVNVTQR